MWTNVSVSVTLLPRCPCISAAGFVACHAPGLCGSWVVARACASVEMAACDLCKQPASCGQGKVDCREQCLWIQNSQVAKVSDLHEALPGGDTTYQS